MISHIPENIVDQVMSASDIVEIISKNVFLKKTGRNFIGLCPFHTEKTPSFTVSPEKQIYYCFGCGQGGNIFSFLMKYEGLSFPESVLMLGDYFGIKVLRKGAPTQEQHGGILREAIIAINSDAMLFFHQNLVNSKGKNPEISYLTKRGISPAMIDTFKIGYAPAQWHSLEKYLVKKKWQKNIIAASGLTILKKGSNTSYDRFRNRITFPIFDSRNSVIGFGARTIDNSQPKYLNSPETPLFNKSKSLYGINIAKKECMNNKTIFIVEGYFDLISLHQFGIKNVVATLGTAITANHIRQIRGLVGNLGKVILVYDSDQAGLRAAHRSLDVFQREIVDVKIMILPVGHDPDSFIMEFGQKKFISESQKANTALSFMVDLSINQNGLNVNGKIKIINNLKHYIAAISNSLSRALSIQYLAERIDVNELLIQQEVNSLIEKKIRTTSNRDNRNNFQKFIASEDGMDLVKTYRLERKILAMLLQFKDMLDFVKRKQLTTLFYDKSLRNIANLVIAASTNGQHDLNNIVELCDNEREKSIIAELSLSKEKWNKEGCIRLIKQFEDIVSKENDSIIKEIAIAEQTGNNEALSELLKKKQSLARTINRNTNTKI